MVQQLIETPGARFAIARVAEATRAGARAGCARLLDALASDGMPGTAYTSKAHSGHWIAVGLSREYVIGVDVEVARALPRQAQIADWLGFASSDETSFWARWTLRESLAKCTGGSVLVRDDAEPSLLGATEMHGEWTEAGDFGALCGRLGGNIYYSLALRRPAPDEARRCA